MRDTLLKIFAEIKQGSGNPTTLPDTVNTDKSGDLKTTVINIINAVIGVLGLAAVVIIIIGGINYMMSSGEASKVKKAKDTILYGVIGLVICVLAFAIVNFIIGNILSNG